MRRLSKHIFTAFRISLAAGLIYYLVTSGSINWSSLTGLAKTWHYTIFAGVLFFIATAIQAKRLQILINACQLELSFLSSIKLTFIGLFFNTYLPGATGGDLAKIYYASKGNPGKRTEVITILLLDRFIGLFCLLLLPLLLTPFFIPAIETQKVLQALLGTSLVISITIIAVMSIVSRINFANSRITQWLESKMIFGARLKRALRTIYSYRNHKGAITQVVLLSLISHFIMVIVSMIIAQATSPEGADTRMLLLIPLAYFANSLPVTPGGLGVGEAAMESLFKLFHLQGGAEVILGWRLIMVLIGLIGLFFYLKGEQRFVFHSEEKPSSEN